MSLFCGRRAVKKVSGGRKGFLIYTQAWSSPREEGLRPNSSLFLLGEKMVAQRFDNARVALPEPFYYLPVPELCLFVICELLVLLALGVESTFGDLGPD